MREAERLVEKRKKLATSANDAVQAALAACDAARRDAEEKNIELEAADTQLRSLRSEALVKEAGASAVEMPPQLELLKKHFAGNSEAQQVMDGLRQWITSAATLSAAAQRDQSRGSSDGVAHGDQCPPAGGLPGTAAMDVDELLGAASSEMDGVIADLCKHELMASVSAAPGANVEQWTFERRRKAVENLVSIVSKRFKQHQQG